VQSGKVLCAMLHEAHQGQVEEIMDTLQEGAGGSVTDACLDLEYRDYSRNRADHVSVVN
jgi:hypothetical protein